MALDLLSLLDAGEGLTPPERALLLAENAPGPPRVALEPVGRTTARVLRLHEELAGRVLEGTVACSGCGATVEFAVGTDDLLGAAPPGSGDPVGGLRWRPVAYEDLVAASRASDGVQAVRVVLARCVEGLDSADWGDAPALRGQLAQAMAQADPLAEIELELCCPECGSGVRALLDVVEFTWAQVAARAEALMLEVDALARAYSWSEAEILALPAPRRRRFVDLVTGGS